MDFFIHRPEPDEETHEDEARAGYAALGILLILLSAAIVLSGGWYIAKGLGWAVFLPAWRDHHTAARQEWVREQGQDAHPVERLMLRACLVGIVVLFVSGLLMGGVA